MLGSRGWAILHRATLAVLLLAPVPVSAQFAAIEGFLRNVTDISFYGGFSNLSPAPDNIRPKSGHLASFGVEMLFQIGSIKRPLAAPAQPPAADTATNYRLLRMEVTHGVGSVDTMFVYEPVKPTAAPPLMETLWTFEMGIGYGQMTGFELRTDPAFTLKGAVRDLPAASIYLSHEATGLYTGLRTGFMRTQGLQVASVAGGQSADGTGEAFFLGLLGGYAFDIGGVNLFLEPAYILRSFPSVTWKGDGLVLPVAPRELALSGFAISTGIQVRLGN